MVAELLDRWGMSTETTRVRGLAPWQPQLKTVELLGAAIIRNAIDERLDQEAYAAVLAREERIREKPTARLASLATDFGSEPHAD